MLLVIVYCAIFSWQCRKEENLLNFMLSQPTFATATAFLFYRFAYFCYCLTVELNEGTKRLQQPSHPILCTLFKVY